YPDPLLPLADELLLEVSTYQPVFAGGIPPLPIKRHAQRHDVGAVDHRGCPMMRIVIQEVRRKRPENHDHDGQKVQPEKVPVRAFEKMGIPVMGYPELPSVEEAHREA